MIRISLPDDDSARLEAALRGPITDAKLRHRVQIVLTAHRGRRHPGLAADTGTSHRSVARWLDADLDRGPDGLTPRKAPGAEPTPTADLAPAPRRWVIDGPARHGPDRANGTYAELADHLLEANGIRVGTSAVQAFGARRGIRPHRPTCRLLRGDPAERPKAREETSGPEKGGPRATLSCRAGTRPGSRWPRPGPPPSG